MRGLRMLLAVLGLFLRCPLWSADARRTPSFDACSCSSQRIQHEQQSVFQHFQMIQELRRAEMERLNPPVVTNPPYYDEAPSYEKQQEYLQDTQERIRRYGADLDGLYARYRELEERKRQLLDRMLELSQ